MASNRYEASVPILGSFGGYQPLFELILPRLRPGSAALFYNQVLESEIGIQS
jgi:hypothetical protein